MLFPVCLSRLPSSHTLLEAYFLNLQTSSKRKDTYLSPIGPTASIVVKPAGGSKHLAANNGTVVCTGVREQQGIPWMRQQRIGQNEAEKLRNNPKAQD